MPMRYHDEQKGQGGVGAVVATVIIILILLSFGQELFEIIKEVFS